MSFALLNKSSTFTLMGATLVPYYISTVDLDYLYINLILKKILNGLYRFDLLHSQQWMNSVVFFELYFDPFFEDMMHTMITMEYTMRKDFYGIRYGRTMGTFSTFKSWGPSWISKYLNRWASRQNSYYYIIDDFNYTTPD